MAKAIDIDAVRALDRDRTGPAGRRIMADYERRVTAWACPNCGTHSSPQIEGAEEANLRRQLARAKADALREAATGIQKWFAHLSTTGEVVDYLRRKAAKVQQGDTPCG